MRTPSRAALALAMGVFTAGGITAVATTTASAAPGHGQAVRALHSVHFSVPGTGVRMTSTLDDEGNVVSTSAGDDDGDEVGVGDDGVELGDDNDAAEPVDSTDDQGEDGDSQGDVSGSVPLNGSDLQGGDDQGEDAQDEADDQGEDTQEADDQGEDTQGDNSDDQGEDVNGSNDDGSYSDSGDQGDNSDDQGDDSGSDSGSDGGDD